MRMPDSTYTTQFYSVALCNPSLRCEGDRAWSQMANTYHHLLFLPAAGRLVARSVQDEADYNRPIIKQGSR